MVEWSFDTQDAQAAQQARLEFAERVHGMYGDTVDPGAAEIVLGELIGNVVRYAPGPAYIRADFDERGVTIAVEDRGMGFTLAPIRRETEPLRDSGRGLAIVAQLAHDIEVIAKGDDGCCVRARLDVRSVSAN